MSQVLVINGVELEVDRTFKDIDPNKPMLFMRDGQICYTDGRPCTNPNHLSIVPESLRASLHARPVSVETDAPNQGPEKGSGTTCPTCGFEARSVGALKGHIRFKHKAQAAGV